MINPFVVKLATDYLNRRLTGEPGTLVGMVHEIDYIHRVIPRFEEVNKALKQCPSIYVHRAEEDVEFVTIGRERKITFEDMERAYVRYREWLESAHERLRTQH